MLLYITPSSRMTWPRIVAFIVQFLVLLSSICLSSWSTSMILELKCKQDLFWINENVNKQLGLSCCDAGYIYLQLCINLYLSRSRIIPMSLMDKWWGCSEDNWSIKSKNLSVVPVSSLLSVSDSELSSRPVNKQLPF